MNSVAKPKKLSFIKEIYYPPGYSGYSPQIPYRFGETYGETTNKLLTDPNVAKSNRSVLADTIPKKLEDEDEKEDKNSCLKYQKESWGNKKLTTKMVPGYTGYVPKETFHFGRRYAQTCKRAISEFTADRNHHDYKRQQLKPIEPLVPIRAEAKPYVPLHQAQHSVSPYFMKIKDPAKTFISGYTGFIPKARSRFGQVYTELTNDALVDFTKNQMLSKRLEKEPVTVDRSEEFYRASMSHPNQKIYLPEGLIPLYTGYLPGHKFQFGSTFGKSSRRFSDDR